MIQRTKRPLISFLLMCKFFATNKINETFSPVTNGPVLLVGESQDVGFLVQHRTQLVQHVFRAVLACVRYVMDGLKHHRVM